MFYLRRIDQYGENLVFFLFMKYIIFVNVIKNFRYVIVPGSTWIHHGRCPPLCNFFSRQLWRWFRCFWKLFFYMCCILINRSFSLCYCYFPAKFPLSSALNMAAVREQIFLVLDSYTTFDTTSLWSSEGLPWVLKRIFLAMIVSHCSVHLDTL